MLCSIKLPAAVAGQNGPGAGLLKSPAYRSTYKTSFHAGAAGTSLGPILRLTQERAAPLSMKAWISYSWGDIELPRGYGQHLLVSINKAELTVKDDWSLIWTCVSPFVFKVRGKNDLMKMNVYRQLSEHQKRLFIFTIYYNHARQSVDDFIYYSKLLLENDYWHELTGAMGFFKNSKMVDLLNRIEIEMGKSQLAIDTDLPANKVVAASIENLFKYFLPVSDETLKLIGNDIRQNPTAYFNIEE